MSEIIKNHPNKKPGPTPKYPWGEWFDGQTRRLIGPKKTIKQARHLDVKSDFECSIDSMSDMIRAYAVKLNKNRKKENQYSVKITKERDRILPDVLILTVIVGKSKR